MSEFICPVCGGKLERCEKIYRCSVGHSYDISKRGYVNLLMSQASSKKRHGDDTEMVNARTRFLSLDKYSPLRDEVSRIVCDELYARGGGVIADIGCGECYYTEHISKALDERKISHQIYGIDISKKALDAAGRRKANIELAVASAFSIPIAENCSDVIINLFAPHEANEFFKIAKDNALLIRVFPLAKHLWELKCAVYDEPYENEIDTLDFDGFTLLYTKEMKYGIHLDTNRQILDLFSMTPYCYKTSSKDRAKLDNLGSLDTRVEFCIAVYRKTAK